MRTAAQTISGAYGELLAAPDTNGRSAPHFHATHAIGVSLAGEGMLFARGRSWSYAPGMIVVTNPFDPHWGRPLGDALSYSLLYPRPAWLERLCRPARPLHFDNAVIDDPGLTNRLKTAFDTVAGGGGDGPLAAAVGELFARHARLAPPPRPEPVACTGGGLPIADRAAEAGLSRAHFSRRYRQLTGLSPLDHRRQARVLAAREMIEAGAALAAAAADAGFADQAHMTRQFRQILGVTPTAYRPRA
jgi:AraC-like DNA-binding protein